MGADIAVISQETLTEFQTLYRKFREDIVVADALQFQYDDFLDEGDSHTNSVIRIMVDEEAIELGKAKLNNYQKKIIEGRFYKAIACADEISIEGMTKALGAVKKFEKQRKHYQAIWEELAGGDMAMTKYIGLQEEHLPVFKEKLEKIIDDNPYLQDVTKGVYREMLVEDRKPEPRYVDGIPVVASLPWLDKIKNEPSEYDILEAELALSEGLLAYQGLATAAEDIRTVFEILQQNPQYVDLMIDELITAQDNITEHMTELRRILTYLEDEDNILELDEDENEDFLTEIIVQK